MNADETPREPIPIRKTRTAKRGTSGPKVTPAPTESQSPITETQPQADIPALVGDPDHALVPIPPKKLLEPAEFFRYWHSIPQRERDSWFIAYAYRKLPVCDVLQPLTLEELKAIERHQRKKPDTNCGKLSQPFNPDNWEQDVYQWKGAGDYQIRLNDNHPSVKGTVCETHIRGLRDWDNFPPILHENTRGELDEVVLAEPLNQPYLRWARLRGIKFPGDPGADNPSTPFDNEDEMANVAAVEKLTDALVDATRNRPQPVPVAAPAPPDRSNEILADAALKGQQILLDSVRAQGKAQDPMEFHKAVTDAAKAMVPPPAPSSDNGAMLTMMQTMMTQQATQFQALMAQQATGNAAIVAQLEKRLESSERRAEAAEQRAQAALQAKPTAGTDNGITNALALIDGLAKLKDKTTSILGTEAADADLPVWARVGMKVAENLPDMLHNAAVMWTGKGTPVPPLSPEVIEAENQPPAVEAAQQQPQQQEEEVFGKSRIAQELAAPLMDAINKGHHGFEFAAGMILQPKIMGFPGRVVYEMAIEEGQDGLLQILQSHPPLWQQLIVIPKRLQSFITEFLDRDMAYQVAKGAQQQAQQPQAQESVLPVEVLPPQQPAANGRVVMGGDGKPIQTAGKKGPVVNGPAAPGPLSA